MEQAAKERLTKMGLDTDEKILAAGERIANSSPFGAPPFGSDTAMVKAVAEEVAAKGKGKGK